jgi:hypothetical protein
MLRKPVTVMQQRSSGFKKQCPKVEATEVKYDDCEVYVNVFQWSEAWWVQRTRRRTYPVDVLKKKSIVLIICEAIKYGAQEIAKSHIISSRQASVGVYVSCRGTGSVIVRETYSARNCQQTLRTSLLLFSNM